MKLAAFLVMFLCANCAAADTYTAKYGLRLPDTDVEDLDTPWGVKNNNNFVLIDAALDAVNSSALAMSTGAFNTRLTAVETSTGVIKSQANSVAVSTGVIKAQVDAVAVSTGAIALSTGTLKTQINSVATSTGAIYNTAAFLASTQTFTGQNTFSGNSSTTTFNGWIDVGVHIVTDGTGTPQDDTVCPLGEIAISCGCNSGGAISQLYAVALNTCRCYTSSGAANAIAVCARVK